MRSPDSLRMWNHKITEQHKKIWNRWRANEWSGVAHKDVSYWLASAEGGVRALDWALGKKVWNESFYPLNAAFLNNMRLPGWDESWARPEGHLPFEEEAVATYDERPEGVIRAALQLANRVHKRVMTIDKLHPGKWSIMYQERVKDWLVFMSAVIRTLDWILGNRDEDSAFYVFTDAAMQELDNARRGLHAYSSDALIGIDRMLGMDLTDKDYERTS